MKRVILLVAAALLLTVTRLPAPAPRSMQVHKTCPSGANPGDTVTCSFSVHNNYLPDGVAELRVSNTVPYPGGSTTALPCYILGTDITVLGDDSGLGPSGSGTDTCTGTVDETVPGACGGSLADIVQALGDATDASCTDCSSGFASASVAVGTCTSTPIRTATPTPTRTPPPSVFLTVNKTCTGGPFNPGDSVTCTFSVSNFDPASGVSGLVVTDVSPYPGGTGSAVPCKIGGVPVTTLAPRGTTGDTCTGAVTETVGACQEFGHEQADHLLAEATDDGCSCPTYGDDYAFYAVSACTPTPTVTAGGPTSTPTATPLLPTATETPTPGGPTATPTTTAGPYTLRVSKSCPSTAGVGETFTCSFSVTNETGALVTTLFVRNTVPCTPPDCTGPGDTLYPPIPCYISGVAVTVLDVSETCTDEGHGQLTETQVCGGLTDRLGATAATGHGVAQGYAFATVAALACSPTVTGTNTPTPTLTRTPSITSTPTITGTRTVTPSLTPTITGTRTATVTPTPTGTAASPTPSLTPTITRTPTPTNTFAFYPSPTSTPIVTPICGGPLTVTVAGPTSGGMRVSLPYSGTASGGTPPYHYKWTCAFDPARPIMLPAGSAITCNYPNIGGFVVEALVQDAHGVRGMCGVKVTVSDIPCAFCTVTATSTNTRTPTPTNTRTPTTTLTPVPTWTFSPTPRPTNPG